MTATGGSGGGWSCATPPSGSRELICTANGTLTGRNPSLSHPLRVFGAIASSFGVTPAILDDGAGMTPNLLGNGGARESRTQQDLDLITFFLGQVSIDHRQLRLVVGRPSLRRLARCGSRKLHFEV